MKEARGWSWSEAKGTRDFSHELCLNRRPRQRNGRSRLAARLALLRLRDATRYLFPRRPCSSHCPTPMSRSAHIPSTYFSQASPSPERPERTPPVPRPGRTLARRGRMCGTRLVVFCVPDLYGSEKREANSLDPQSKTGRGRRKGRRTSSAEERREARRGLGHSSRIGALGARVS